MGLIDKIKNFIYSDNSEYDEQMDDGYAEEESDAGSSSSSSSPGGQYPDFGPAAGDAGAARPV